MERKNEFELCTDAVRMCSKLMEDIMDDGNELIDCYTQSAAELASELDNFQRIFAEYVEYIDAKDAR